MLTPQSSKGVRAQSPTGRKLALSLGLIVISAVYAVWQNVGGTQSLVANVPVAPIQTAAAPVPVAAAPAAPAPSPAPASAPSTPSPMGSAMMKKKMGMYADGSYTGTPADAYYGTIQVKAIVANGKLADVQFLQYPNDRSTSVYINGQAMPMLTQEAIQAQSANVSGVSGATDTSMAFVQSLSAALALAKN